MFTDIANLISDLAKTLKIIDQIVAYASDLNLNNISKISYENNSIDFQDSLVKISELKSQKSQFDQLRSIAEISVNEINILTDHAISSVNDIKMALISASDIGNQLVNEATMFAELLLRYYKQKGELETAEQDRKTSTIEIQKIIEEITKLDNAQNTFVKDRKTAMNNYELQIEEFQQIFEEANSNQKQSHKKIILGSFNEFKNSFNSLKNEFLKHLSSLQTSIHQKFYGLKEHSMNQRSMVLALFMDYCDAEFYNSFRSCDSQNIPSMSEDFESILTKLNDLKWNTIVSKDSLDGIPEEFTKHFKIETTSKEKLFETKNIIVHTLREMNEVYINLKNLVEGKAFMKRFWRVRIETVTMVLLDKDSNLIQPKKSKSINIQIRYPTRFNDQDKFKKYHNFWAKDFLCTADYQVSGLGRWISLCQIYILCIIFIFEIVC